MIDFHVSKKSVSFSVAWNTISQVAGRFLGLLTSIPINFVLAQRFGAAGYGDFTKITTFVGVFYLLSDFGFNAIFLQKITKRAESSLWPNLLGLRLLASAVAMLLSLVILAFIPGGLGQGYTAFVRFGIIIFLPTIFFQAFLTSANAIFQKEQRYDLSTIALALGGISTLLFLFPLFALSDSASGVLLCVIAFVVGSIVTAGVALVLARRFTGTLAFRFDIQKVVPMVIASFPLGLTILLNVIYFRADSVILTLTRSTREVGTYGLAYKIFELVLVLPTFFVNALYPIMLATGNQPQNSRRKNLLRLFKKSFALLVGTSAVLVLIVWVGAPLIAWIRSDFTQSVDLLRILSLGYPFFFVTALTMWILITLEKQVTLVWIYGLSMVVNIVLNILFIPQFGAMAAAWVTVISEGVVLLLSGFTLMYLWKTTKVRANSLNE